MIQNDTETKIIVSRVSSETAGWSADVYCQIINNPKHTQSSYLYRTERRDECAGQQRDRERVCVSAQIAAKMRCRLS
jgi:hypothetical protein